MVLPLPTYSHTPIFKVLLPPSFFLVFKEGRVKAGASLPLSPPDVQPSATAPGLSGSPPLPHPLPSKAILLSGRNVNMLELS